ncbi:SRPBCC family protein [Streptomyces sp. NPDC006193]|uniref:SRPBCC family protein n=1 Tax=Streptomyces sp. NPDC006193 TaxID=3155717 RepID=UPI0033A3E833
MEHQVFVPVSADRIRAALTDPARVARAVPGLQQDAGAEPVAGRLRLRVGGHSVTYRGVLRVAAREDGAYAVEADAAEARGAGSVKLALTLRLTEGDGGTTVTVEGTADADGRIRELPQDAVVQAVTRLLTRSLEDLAPAVPEQAGGAGTPGAGAEREPADTPAEPPAGRGPEGGPEHAGPGAGPEPGGTGPGQESGRGPVSGAASGAGAADAGADAGAADAGAVAEAPGSARGAGSGPDATPPTPGPDADDGGPGGGSAGRVPEGFADTGEPPAEAAHARRTMIGRSAEEVDHAPPRGRYAPVPAPQTVAGNPALRWAAPAAALALASAVVLTRALRKRR